MAYVWITSHTNKHSLLISSLKCPLFQINLLFTVINVKYIFVTPEKDCSVFLLTRDQLKYTWEVKTSAISREI